MTIRRSDIIGKSINELDKSITDYLSLLRSANTPHKVWVKTSTKAIDLLSRCTLSYSNSYGASYKIDPTSELTIIHTDGTKYPVASYTKLLTMVITDYAEPTGTTMTTNPPNSVPNYLKRKPNIYDYVERTIDYDTRMPKGSIWKVTAVPNSYSIIVTDSRGTWDSDFFKVINPEHPSHPNYQEQSVPTQPQPGTHWERLVRLSPNAPKGQIVKVFSKKRQTPDLVWFDTSTSLNGSDVANRRIADFLYNFKHRPDLDTPASEATEDNIIKSKLKVGDTIGYNEEYCNASNYPNPDRIRYKVIGTVTSIKERDSRRNPLVRYKTPSGSTDIVNEGRVEILLSPSTKTTKPKPVAPPEPIIPTPIKETFMSKIQASASATVDQNKQALVIASKMEAGRIINKQVLKQLTPNLPFFLQGYAKSPFAPFIAANLVAMVANHTGNSKLTKVSDLMLLGAADSGIATFNLDKIVDDILSNIKLPAGVLDDSDNN